MENIFLISFRNNFSKRAKEEKLYKILQFDYPKKAREKRNLCLFSAEGTENMENQGKVYV
jgi:hypothetical protein